MSYVLADGVAYLENPHQSGLVYVAQVPDGEPLVLEGSAALIWQAALDESEPEGPEDVCTIVAQWLGISAEVIAPDVHSFLIQLLDSQLLEVR